MAKSLEKRLLAIEKAFGDNVPGTQLIRSLHEDEGVCWTLAVGPMLQPKRMWTGKTITEVIELAEQWFKIN